MLKNKIMSEFKEGSVFDGKREDIEGLGKLIKEEIEKHGRPAREVLLDEMDSSQVLVVGENHIDAFGPLRRLILDLLPELKEKGLTTLALEEDSGNQGVVDDFLKGKITASELAERTTFGLYKNMAEDWIKIFNKAKELGLQIKAVDHDQPVYEDDQGSVDHENNRDKGMFDGIKEISGDGKVLMNFGNLHVNTDPELGRNGRDFVYRLGYRAKEQGLPWTFIETVSPVVGVANLQFHRLSEFGISPKQSLIIPTIYNNFFKGSGCNVGGVDYVLFIPEPEVV